MSPNTPSGSPAGAGETAFDELADLFLGDDAPTPHTPANRISVQALIVGHLPALAGPWVSQHARDLVAETNAPVAVLSRSGDRATLDLYQSPPIAEVSTIEDAIDAAAAAGIMIWLVRTDPVTEVSLTELSRVDGLTLLTGADEAAVVGSYRALKGLMIGHGELDDPGLPIGLAVMGSDHAKGRAAAEKIRRAIQSFLDTGLSHVAISSKVTPTTPPQRIFDGTSDSGIAELLDRIPLTPSPQPRHSDGDHSPLRLAVPEIVVRPQPEPQTPPSPPGDTHVEPMKSKASASRVGPMTSNQASLASMLGLAPIEPRCPYADDVELATDTEGRAHLIAHAEQQDISRAVESLQIAETWIGAHLTLLGAATQGAVRTSPPLEPMRHLIVDHAPAARRLLDSGIKVSVLAQGNHESMCIALN